ncbi:hypothetical protein ACFW5I_06220 [Streptomyces sp. NPDC058818]|uniref:hypothetical protein n=1 Tax=Streptomyces sp. NPDC058818 TaxID=3346640 RepID=UPI003689F588
MRSVVEGEVDAARRGCAAGAQEIGALPGGQRAVTGLTQGAQLGVEVLRGDDGPAAVVGADAVVGEDDRRAAGAASASTPAAVA